MSLAPRSIFSSSSIFSQKVQVRDILPARMPLKWVLGSALAINFLAVNLTSCGSQHTAFEPGHETSLSGVMTKGGSMAFPVGPDSSMTPGRLCDHPDSYRFPEQIAYCSRNVSSSRKWHIIHQYDQVLGYHIEEMGRSEFKIDHLIPLCFGGSNDNDNLWPQHKSVYNVTDTLENQLCNLLGKGVVTQSRAVEMILTAKSDLSVVPSIQGEIKQLEDM